MGEEQAAVSSVLVMDFSAVSFPSGSRHNRCWQLLVALGSFPFHLLLPQLSRGMCCVHSAVPSAGSCPALQSRQEQPGYGERRGAVWGGEAQGHTGSSSSLVVVELRW